MLRVWTPACPREYMSRKLRKADVKHCHVPRRLGAHSTFCNRPVERARMMTRLFLSRAVCARQFDSGGRAGQTQPTRAVRQSHNPFAEGVA